MATLAPDQLTVVERFRSAGDPTRPAKHVRVLGVTSERQQLDVPAQHQRAGFGIDLDVVHAEAGIDPAKLVQHPGFGIAGIFADPAVRDFGNVQRARRVRG